MRELRALSRALYRTGSIFRWIIAIGGGPGTTAKRAGRVIALRRIGRWLR